MSSFFIDLFTIYNLLQVLKVLAIIIAVIIIDRVFRSSITKYSQKLSLDTNLVNALKLISRIIIFVAGAVAFLQLFGMQADWLISVSALGGAAIGFASTQTVGNLLAGVYIMMSRPFLVNDYVRIGDHEGEVKEITVNYTKLYTPTFNIIEVPNRRVLDSVIVNFSKEDIIDWTFTIGFPHEIPYQELIDKSIIPALEEFYKKYEKLLPRKPEHGLCRMDRLGKDFSIRIFFLEKKMDTFYNLQPEILGDIVRRWDILRKK
jgi:small-conductance mechanosensitive channel